MRGLQIYFHFFLSLLVLEISHPTLFSRLMIDYRWSAFFSAKIFQIRSCRIVFMWWVKISLNFSSILIRSWDIAIDAIYSINNRLLITDYRLFPQLIPLIHGNVVYFRVYKSRLWSINLYHTTVLLFQYIEE